MISWIGVGLVEVVVLWRLAVKVRRVLYGIGGRYGWVRVTVGLWPGTLVHEVAHLLVAVVLGVKVGKVSLFPRVDGNHVKFGFVQVAKVDPIRNFMVSFAPVVLGLIINSMLGYVLVYRFILNDIKVNGWLWWVLVVLIVYVMFVVNVQMWPSHSDIRHGMVFIGLLGVLMVLFGIGFWDKKELVLEGVVKVSKQMDPEMVGWLKKVVVGLGVNVGVMGAGLLGLKLKDCNHRNTE